MEGIEPMRLTITALILALSCATGAVAQDAPLPRRFDTQGRRFRGVCDDLVVEQPDGRGNYGERRLLCRFPTGSVVADIEIRGNDVYVLTHSALYLIPSGIPSPKKLLWGIPRGPGSQGFRALAWGPEGDLYCSFGDTDRSDRWRIWTFFSQPNGTKTPYSGIGGVVRCKPDGTDLRVVATGLRDPRTLAFDRYWNLFTSHADQDKSVSLHHVTPNAYFGWPRAGTALLPAAPESKRPPIADDLPSDPYDAVTATPAKLWQELSDPSWPRRCRAHVELLRRGGDLLKQANKRILDAPLNDPALHHLIWLAAKSQRGSLHLLSLVADPDPLVRLQVARALTEYPEQLREEPIFTKLLVDPDPRVRFDAMLAHFSPKVAWDRPVQSVIERGPARSDDPLQRQTATRLLGEKATPAQIEALCGRFDASFRLAGILAAGYRLTLPSATKPLHAQLPLAKLRDESACVIEYADGKIDLRERGRVGTFTVAEHWKADMHTEEQERLFKLLRKMLSDEDEPVRVQAARFLALLNDSRCAAEVERVLNSEIRKSKSETNSNSK
jgi:hypothetical protein